MSNIVYVLNHMFISACMCKCRTELHAPRNARSSSFAASSTTYSSSSSSLSICHWIIARLCMHSRQLFSKSNCPAINPQIVSQNQWERSRSLTSQPLALNRYILSPSVIYNASTAHLHTGEITGLSRSHSPSINASHIFAEDPQPNDWHSPKIDSLATMCLLLRNLTWTAAVHFDSDDNDRSAFLSREYF